LAVSSVVPKIATQIGAVSREVDLIAPQIAPDGIDLALFLSTPPIPHLGRTEVSCTIDVRQARNAAQPTAEARREPYLQTVAVPN
jgi:hypothetical protein